jgi:hypothetical protein
MLQMFSFSGVNVTQALVLGMCVAAELMASFVATMQAAPFSKAKSWIL